MADESKLPKWAQEELRLLRMRLEESRLREAKLKNERAPAEGMPSLGIGRDHTFKSMLNLPIDEDVRWEFGDRTFIEARFRTRQGRKAGVEIMCSGQVSVHPTSSNTFTIILED